MADIIHAVRVTYTQGKNVMHAVKTVTHIRGKSVTWFVWKLIFKYLKVF